MCLSYITENGRWFIAGSRWSTSPNGLDQDDLAGQDQVFQLIVQVINHLEPCKTTLSWILKWNLIQAVTFYLSINGLVELRARMLRICCSKESSANPRRGELPDPTPGWEQSNGGDGGRIELLHRHSKRKSYIIWSNPKNQIASNVLSTMIEHCDSQTFLQAEHLKYINPVKYWINVTPELESYYINDLTTHLHVLRCW